MAEKRKPFNKYTLTEAYKFLNLTRLTPWNIQFTPIEATSVFHETLKRLDAFDISFGERGKEVLIDAILQEALSRRTKLKVWKEVSLKTETLSGRSEYVFAQRIDILTHPFVCLAEAKKDDFEKGLARCLLGMKACQMINLKSDISIEIHGIVTNAFGWRFYKLTLQDEVSESLFYSFQTQMPTLFGILDAIFETCEKNLFP
ncbi:MAG: hypothetical protein GY795_23140 [Desulfobacterales bacterium]|nr:hypothetical protein [Desulfobacterales bacterium]